MGTQSKRECLDAITPIFMPYAAHDGIVDCLLIGDLTFRERPGAPEALHKILQTRVKIDAS